MSVDCNSVVGAAVRAARLQISKLDARWMALALALFTLAASSSSALAEDGPAAPGTTLEAIDSDGTPIVAATETAVPLAVIKKTDGAAVGGQEVVWKIAGPGGATLDPDRGLSSAPGAEGGAGIVRTVFHASSPGNYVVTASSRSNAECEALGCEQYAKVEFVIQIEPATSTTETKGHGRGIAIGAAAAAAIAALANGGDSSEPAATRLLFLQGGDGQSALPNRPVNNLLIVRATNGDKVAAGTVIQWTATGGAVLSAPSTVINSLGLTSISVLSVGPGPGPVTVTATRADSGASVNFTLTVLNPGLEQISGNGQSAATDTQVASPLVVRALLGTAPQAGLAIVWTVVSGDASISSVSNGGLTDGAGLSNAVISFGPTPGPVVIRAARSDFPTVTQSFTLFATLTRSLSVVSGFNQTAPPNTALPAPLVVRAQNNGTNIAGITINWFASGGATLSSNSSVTDATGQASITVTSTGPGPDPLTITAVRADDPTGTVTIGANIVPPVLSIVSGDNQTGLTGNAAPLPLEVVLVDGGGAPVVGQTISWNTVGGSASLGASSSVTDAAGHATVTFSFGSSPGAISIQASAYAGAQTVTFTATAQTASSVQASGGNGQSGNPGTTLAPLVITIVPPPGATDLSGVPVTFTITSGTGTLSVTSTVTDINGQASTQLTLGLTPGTVTVVAQVSGGPSTTFTATINGTLVATGLTVISGDQQTLATGVASLPMVVELKDGATVLAGQTITWSTNNGTVASFSSVTDAAGRTSMTVTPGTGGAVVVTANFAAVAQYTASSTSFTHNATIASITALTTDEAAVAVALDNACAELQVTGTLTPEQQDLLNQCLALGAASGVNPVAVADAIEELLPDVAQTQTQTGQTAVNAQFDNLKARVATLRGGSFGSSFSGLALSTAGGNLPLAGLGALLLGDDGATKKEETFQRWGVFASGNIGRGEMEPGSRTPEYDFDINGLTLGVDYRKTDKLVLGVALGYTRQDTTLAAGEGSLGMHGFSVSAYSTYYRENSWYMDTALTLARNRFAHRRRILYDLPLPGGGVQAVDQLANASSDGSDRSAMVSFGRDFNRKAWGYGFYGRFIFSRQGFDGFSEELDGPLAGSGLGLRIDSRSVKSLSSVFGGKLSYTHSTSWGVIVPLLGLEWQREYSGDPEAFSAFLLNDPTGTPILVTGEALDNSYFRFSVGLTMVLTKGRSGFAQYEKILGRDGMTQDGLSLGFRMEF